MGIGTPPKTDRDWAIWRAYRVSGMRQMDIAKTANLVQERIGQIIVKADRKVREALIRSEGMPVSDEVRDATLGVEFVFTYECLLSDDDLHERSGSRTRTWNNLDRNKKKRGGPEYHPLDEHIYFRVKRED